jgi:hypothetical protein
MKRGGTTTVEEDACVCCELVEVGVGVGSRKVEGKEHGEMKSENMVKGRERR